MAFPQVAAFAWKAEGGAQAKRIIAGNTSKLSRSAHDIQYDDLHDEIVIPNPFAQAILTFRGGTNGEVAPIRIIQGPHTEMVSPDFMDIDPVHNEIFVIEGESILVFPRTATGDVAPIRVVRGPDTGLGGSGTRAIAVDPVHNVMVVRTTSRRDKSGKRGSQLLIFNRTDNGNVKPRAVIAGPKTGLMDGDAGNDQLRIYAPKGSIFVLYSRKGAGEGEGGDDGVLAVWNIQDQGDVPPRWALGGPKSKVSGLRLALNPKAKEVFVAAETRLQAYYVPEFF